ncbi:MAG: histidinol-phosphatase [Pseudomonadales bacterium]
MTLPTSTADTLMRFAHDVVAQAGVLSLEFFRRSINVENKASEGLFDPVTEADRAVEQCIRAALRKKFPAHNIVGEEFGAEDNGSEYCWVIDPIDGTRSFISGVPLWGVLLGLRYRGEAIFGVMHQPYLGETFIACSSDTEQQAWFTKGEYGLTHPLKVSNTQALSEAVLVCTHPEIFDNYPNTYDQFLKVAAAARLMRYGGDCYCYAMLAMGQNDLVIETGLKEYDILALVPLVEAAGGVISNWQGEALKNDKLAGEIHVVAAATKSLHREALAVLNGG